MGLLERAIRRTVSDAVGKAVGDAVRQAVEPTATNLTNQATQAINQSIPNSPQQAPRTSGLEGAMANFEQAVTGYATEAAKNMKVCPSCNKATSADKKFCPECGTALPEQTLAQGAICPSCGKQNNLGTKFCQDCGTKLPSAIAEEQAAAEKEAAVMRQWDEMLPQYPKWIYGGTSLYIDDYDTHIIFGAYFNRNSYAATQAVEQYRQLLLQNGFQMAGQYPSMEHLYKMENGVCYHVDTEHCFESGSDCPNIGFDKSEPYGGFYYVKPEPKNKTSFLDLFK